MKNVRPPEFLTNLYRDLRDRRLLLPVVLLAVALVAVPVLLKSNAKSSTMPATSAPAKASDSAAVPAVVTQQLGVTNYKKRLDQLQSKDPFKAPPSADAVTNKVKNASITSANIPSTGSTSSTSTSTGTSSSTSTSTTPSTTSPTTPATGGTPTASPPVSSTPPSSGGSSSSATHHTKPTFHLYTYRVAVKVGEPGKLATRPEVSSLALLPGKSKPILSFLEANGKQALFLVSTDVDSVKGDGRCTPRPADCQYIIMRPGDKASFHYAPTDQRYNLVLKDIHAVEIGHKPPIKVSKAAGNVHLKPKLPLLGQG